MKPDLMYPLNRFHHIIRSTMTVFTSLLHFGLDFITTRHSLDFSPSSEVVTEILFIDSSVTHYQHLLSGMKPGIYPVLLKDEMDGILQITEHLSQFKNLEAIHLVCHGSPGELYLGNTSLNLSNLSIYIQSLQQWSKALNPQADLLIYACEVAEGWQGKAFVKALSQITQTHVAATTEKLGQGYWDFTVKTGIIKAELAFKPQILNTYDHQLAFSITTNNNSQDLLNTLLGNTSGLSNFSLEITGDPNAIGLFQDDPFGLKSGIVLSTGNAVEIPGINTASDFTDFGNIGADLNTDLGDLGVEGDAVTLTITFDANDTAKQLFFQYVFGSEEFVEYGGDIFNDSFELLLNGNNLAKLSDGKTVTINNLVPNGEDSSVFHPDYINNPQGSNTLTKLDGYTQVLTFSGDIIPNSKNTLTIQIQDVSDGSLDSAVFLKSGALGTALPPDTTPSVSFSQPTYQINEDGSLISSEITINRSGDATQPASVDVILTDGTATGGTSLTPEVDYNNTPIPVNFPANQTTATVKIPINLDDRIEPTETVNLALANPSNGIALGSQSKAVLDIVEPNSILPVVNLSISPNSLTESETLTVSASLSSVTNQDVSIHLGFLGTAKKDVDYTVSSDVIVIPAGSTNGSITLTTINDNLIEENESLIIDLSSLTNATAFGVQQVISQLINNPNSSPSPTPQPTPEPTPQPIPNINLDLNPECGCDSLTPPTINNIVPNAGEDTINGSDSNDQLQGDDKKNVLFGGVGSDEVYGKNGDDDVYGGQGINTATGKPNETDVLFGNQGLDYVNASEGADKLYGGKDNDAIFAGKNNDLIYGDLGNDTLLGDLGDDTVIGDTTEPQFENPPGQDLLFGGEGNDIMFGNGNNDTLSGGLGSDKLNGGKGDDQVFGDEDADELYGDLGKDTLCGGDGNDTIYGGTATKATVTNGEDNDELCGGNGDDFLSGNEGQDIIHGEAGNDTLHGGLDGDTLIAGEGDDRIFGESGDDILWGGNGNNTLTGGQGKDLFLIDIQGQQIITDFTQGQDVLVLTAGLTFEQLNFTMNNGGLQIQNQGQTLAILTGISEVNSSDFVL